MAGLGDSFMLPKPGQETEHLWVLITNPDPVTNEAIIFYADTRMVNTGLVDAAVTRGACQTHATFQQPVIRRIQSGVAASPLTPKKIKTAYAAYAAAGLT